MDHTTLEDLAFKAACTGDNEALAQLVQRGGLNVDARNARGETLLMGAVRADSANCVRLLLRHGADASALHPEHGTAGCLAARLGAIQALTALIDCEAIGSNNITVNGKSARPTQTNPLREAVIADQVQAYALLQERMPTLPSVFDKTPELNGLIYNLALEHRAFGILNHLKEHPGSLGKWEKLYLNVRTPAQLETLIEAGFPLEFRDGNSESNLAHLFCANLEHSQALMRKLKDMGLDIDHPNEGGYRPLHWAVLSGNQENVQTLLELGADLESRIHVKRRPPADNGGTALHLSLRKRNGAMAAMLIFAGADYRATAKNGKTALEMALDRPKAHRSWLEAAQAAINTVEARKKIRALIGQRPAP